MKGAKKMPLRAAAMMLIAIYLCSFGLVAGAAAEEADSGISAYLITNVYGDGQKPWILVLCYPADIDAKSVSADDFTVEDYEIEAVYVSADPEIPEESADGPYVLIELSTDYTTDNYTTSGSVSGTRGSSDDDADSDDDSGEEKEIRGSLDSDDDSDGEKEDRSGLDSDDGEIKGGGRSGMSGASGGLSNQLTVTWAQTGDVACADGTVCEGSEETFTTDYTENENLLVENFEQYTFAAEDGTELMYNLFLPDDYDGETAYPLVLFMPDATGEGSDPVLTLTESQGAVIWTTEESQAENPCIVLAPQYEDDNTSDPEYTMELLYDILENYAVDESRIYLVGQSSGTIRSISMMILYPDVFAGAMLVAGQADSDYEDRLGELAGQNIWMICSAGDARAYPGMTAIAEAVEAEGTAVAQAGWSADLTQDEQNALAEAQQAEGTTILFTVYDAGTVMEDDVPVSDVTEHMNTWRVAYDLDTVRSWLFEQSLAE